MLTIFNVVDVIVICFILIYAWLTWKRGFFAEFFELFNFAISLLWALVFFPFVSNLLQKLGISLSLSNTISFLIIWIGIEFFLLYLSRVIFKALPMHFILSRFNRWAGIVPTIVSSLLILDFIGTFLIVLPTNSLIKSQITQSQTLGRLVGLNTIFNKPIEEAFSKSVRDGLVFITSGNDSNNHFVRLKFPNLQLTDDTSAEKILFELLNQERTKRGLNILESNEVLSKIARNHSRDMFDRSYFGHLDPEGKDPLNRVAKTGLHFLALAENISYSPDTLTAHANLMNSTQHRKAILSTRYIKVGIGVVDSGSYGKMITELFAN